MRTVSLTWCLLRYTLRKSVHTESIVCLSTVPPDFNINEIVNLNKKVKSKTRKVAKAPQLTKAAASKTVKDPNHESPKLKAVPECFSFVLDMPLYSEIFDTGSSLHKAIELRLQGETEITVSNKSGGHWESVQRALGEVSDVKVENITNGALVIAYPSGEPATVHMMSKKQVERYWARWNERLFHYWCQRYAQAQEMAR
ncbi:hypothetical protein MAR_000490 [Mya arenaria]|uniref:Uncharacterized protein n=1 Tax=Mya arenaria TaxID=6604 RepID=A0ABY7F8Y2_MYAAR|nr:hypothetical protein MAR_000490 [Mya arenaria]